MNELKEFVTLVEKMRLAQTRYFTLISKAKRGKNPEDFKSARTTLEISKDLERQVDERVAGLKGVFASITHGSHDTTWEGGL